MDSDSLGSEDSVPLPEVPQILPTKSTDNVQSSRSKAAPSPVARKPSLAQPVSPARPFTNSGSPSNSSGLLSEMRPSRRLSQTAQPVKAAPVPPVKISPKKPSVVSVPKKNSKTLLIVGSSIGGLVLLGGIAAILILFVFNTNGKILETDLISGTSANTGFLYPRQWRVLNEENVNGYGDGKAKDGTPTAAIVIEKKSYIQAGIKSATDAQLTTFRTTMVSSSSDGGAQATIKTFGNCDEVKDVSTSASNRRNTKSVGVFTITGTCVKDGSNFTAMYYAMLGQDGYARTVGLMATENSWEQNKAVFTKMVESSDQE